MGRSFIHEFLFWFIEFKNVNVSLHVLASALRRKNCGSIKRTYWLV